MWPWCQATVLIGIAECQSAAPVLRRDGRGLPAVPRHPRPGPHAAQPADDRGERGYPVCTLLGPVLCVQATGDSCCSFAGCHPIHEPFALHSVPQHPRLPGLQPVQDHGPAPPACGKRRWGGESWGTQATATWSTLAPWRKDPQWGCGCPGAASPAEAVRPQSAGQLSLAVLLALELPSVPCPCAHGQQVAPWRPSAFQQDGASLAPQGPLAATRVCSAFPLQSRGRGVLDESASNTQDS